MAIETSQKLWASPSQWSPTSSNNIIFFVLFFLLPPSLLWWVIQRGQLKHPREFFSIQFLLFSFLFFAYNIQVVFIPASLPCFLLSLFSKGRGGGGGEVLYKKIETFSTQSLALPPCKTCLDFYFIFLLASFLFFYKVMFSFVSFSHFFFQDLTSRTDCLTHLRHSRADLQGLVYPNDVSPWRVKNSFLGYCAGVAFMGVT